MIDWATVLVIVIAVSFAAYPLWDERRKRKLEERLAAHRKEMHHMEIDFYASLGRRDILERLLIDELRSLWAKKFVEDLLAQDK